MPIDTSPPALFGGQLFYGHNFPIWAWMLWITPANPIRSQDRPDKGESFAFLQANARVYGVGWYHLYPYKDWDYGDYQTPTEFVFPDGTMRQRATQMGDVAFANLRESMLAEFENGTWPPGLGAPTG